MAWNTPYRPARFSGTTSPDKRQVLPLAPEFVRNIDGKDDKYHKQDCEINAGYRMLERLRSDYPRIAAIIVADSLYSLRNADRAAASFVAPDVDVDSGLTFTLTVTDSGGLNGADTTTVTVALDPPLRDPDEGTRLSQPSVRLIYFLPNDRPLRRERVRAFRRLIKDSQQFFAEQMESHGVGRKLFAIESDDNGTPVVYRVDGDFSDSYYGKSDATGNIDFKVWKEFWSTSKIQGMFISSLSIRVTKI